MVTNPPALPNNNNQHGGQTSTLNLGDPSNVALLHPDYRLPSLASHLSNSTIASITNGEDVDLASLLSFSSLLNEHVSDLKLQIGKEGLTIPLPSPASKRTKITSIDRWLDAFAIYSSVILSSYPSRGGRPNCLSASHPRCSQKIPWDGVVCVQRRVSSPGIP